MTLISFSPEKRLKNEIFFSWPGLVFVTCGRTDGVALKATFSSRALSHLLRDEECTASRPKEMLLKKFKPHSHVHETRDYAKAAAALRVKVTPFFPPQADSSIRSSSKFDRA